MRFVDYIKDKSVFLIVNLGLFLLFTLFMILIKIGGAVITIVFTLWFGPLISYIVIEFLRKRKFFNEISEISEKLDKKFLLTEIVKSPEFLEGKIIHDALRESNKDMYEHINSYKYAQKEYRDYIEMWVHEIKTPIASTKLIIENNKNEVTNNINKELKKVDEMVEQVLYYSKSDDANEDYIVREFPLKKAVMNVVKRNSRDFIGKRIAVDMGEINELVFSDIKWVEFIINQIVGNALKYTNSGGRIKIYSEAYKNKIILTIEDSGVGIPDAELSKVFLKGFTGENGRIFGKSTGIGLYLCQKLCDKLGLGLTLKSEKDKGTKVNIIFPIGENTSFK